MKIPCLWPAPLSTVWHCAHLVLKIFSPDLKSPGGASSKVAIEELGNGRSNINIVACLWGGGHASHIITIMPLRLVKDLKLSNLGLSSVSLKSQVTVQIPGRVRGRQPSEKQPPDLRVWVQRWRQNDWRAVRSGGAPRLQGYSWSKVSTTKEVT
ncbi:zinc transporter [Striga asiatica]|uniref:Zinc transporter n=1 Tax=Striga asiatica TaxID=4170 RepID=A0A5A7P9R6_STRAF|nr:zinc transporter [Striga asiatica]